MSLIVVVDALWGTASLAQYFTLEVDPSLAHDAWPVSSSLPIPITKDDESLFHAQLLDAVRQCGR